jgi:hypothetical protein
MIPNTLRIDHRYGSAHAHPQTIGFCTKNAPIASQFQGIKALFKVIPRQDAKFGFAALRIGRIGAQKDMALNLSNSEYVCFFADALFYGHSKLVA